MSLLVIELNHPPADGDYTWYADQLGRAIIFHDRKLNESFLGVVT